MMARVLQAYLTGEGEGMLSRAHALVEAVEGRMLAGLAQGERPRLLAVLRGCADALECGDGQTAPLQNGPRRPVCLGEI